MSAQPRACRYTPLIAAAKQGRVEAVSLLLEHHTDPSIKDWWGNDALNYAASFAAAKPELPRTTEMLKLAMADQTLTVADEESLATAEKADEGTKWADKGIRGIAKSDSLILEEAEEAAAAEAAAREEMERNTCTMADCTTKFSLFNPRKTCR